MTEAERWRADSGDTTHKVDYPLTENSVVIDVGGHTGDWAEEIHRHYGASLWIYEPVTAFYQACWRRFANHPRIVVINTGLWDKDVDSTPLFVDGTSSSLFVSAAQKVNVRLADIAELPILQGPVDLISLNCEGAEYTILERLLDTGLISLIEHIQVQFHDILPDAALRRSNIRLRLEQTHTERYCYPFVWEAWSRKHA